MTTQAEKSRSGRWERQGEVKKRDLGAALIVPQGASRQSFSSNNSSVHINTSDATNVSFGLMVTPSSPIGRFRLEGTLGRDRTAGQTSARSTHTSTHALFSIHNCIISSVSPLSSGHDKVSTRVLERCKLTNYVQASGQSLQLPVWL